MYMERLILFARQLDDEASDATHNVKARFLTVWVDVETRGIVDNVDAEIQGEVDCLLSQQRMSLAGKLLEGPPGINMVQAVRDFSVPEVPQPPEDMRRLRFLLMTKSGVTVGQVNAALVSIGAQIVEMHADDPNLSIEVPGSDRVDVPGRVLEKLDATQLFELITPLN